MSRTMPVSPPSTLQGIPRLPPGSRRLSVSGKVAAIALLTVASGSLLKAALPAARQDADSGAVFVEDYLRRAVGQDQIHTSDPATVERWLAKELGLSVRLIQQAGLDLEGAEICLLEGRRGAMILYDLNGAKVSHYVVPREGVDGRAPEVGRTAAGELAAPPLVTWSTPSVEQALVGELASEQLLALARTAY